MGIIAEALRHMLEAKMDSAAIVAAVAAMESITPKDEQAERRRQKDRDRKRLRKSAESAETLDKKGFSPHTPLSQRTTPPDSPSGYLPPKRLRGCRLPDGWVPTKSEANNEVERNFSSFELSTQLLTFRDYWQAKSGPTAVKVDWDATWRNWLRKALENRGSRNGKSNGFKGRSGPDFFARMAAVQDTGNEPLGEVADAFRGPEIDLRGAGVVREPDQRIEGLLSPPKAE